MYLRNFKFTTIVCLLFIQTGFSQQLDSIQKLNEVTITSPRFRYFNIGSQYITVDSVSKDLYRSGYLNNILSSSSTLQISSYGAGLSLISARGTGDSHTPILWNGFNLQSIQSGGVDVSQLPSSFFENVIIQLGGCSALFGSGAVGGVVHLSNSANFNQRLKIDIGTYTGSFNNYVENLNFSYGNSFYAASFKIFYNTSKNDFSFSRTYPTDSISYGISGKQINAEAKQLGILFSNYFKIANNQNLNIHFWLQNADKNIAPTLDKFVDSSFNYSNQKDKIINGSAEYSIFINKISVWARSGLFHNKQNFKDSSYSYLDKCISSINEIEVSFSPFASLKFNGGINYTYEEANSLSYSEIKTRNRLALFSSMRLSNDNSQVSFNLRTENVNGVFIPVTFSFGLQQSYFNNFCQLHANVSKNYKLPTFNDLYYYGSGNPDLKPENGLNYEGGLTFQVKENFGKLVLKTSLFHSDMNNWIRWIPTDEFIWSPFNIDKVKMDGLENSIDFITKLKNLNINLKGMYTYIDAINVNTSEIVSYLPKNKLMGSITFTYNTFVFQFQETYQSNVYFKDFNNVTKSNPEVLLSNIAFSSKYNLNGIGINVNIQINNIMNKNYILISNYPMPRRNFMAGLRVIF